MGMLTFSKLLMRTHGLKWKSARGKSNVEFVVCSNVYPVLKGLIQPWSATQEVDPKMGQPSSLLEKVGKQHNG
jgi:hypothetical protein